MWTEIRFLLPLNGNLEFSYQHINDKDEIMMGECRSIYSLSDNGKIIYDENWTWLNGPKTSGSSRIIEI